VLSFNVERENTVKKQAILVILSIFFLCNPINGIIFKSDQLHDVLQYAEKDTFFVFDIDDTIAETPGNIGTDTWLYYETRELEKKVSDINLAFKLMLPLYFLVRNYKKLEIIDHSDEIIAQLQNQKIGIIALTSQSIPMHERTIKQLAELGIDFSLTAPFDKPLELVGTYKSIFKQGIIFSASSNKGKMLIQFFEKTGFKPKKVFFADDKLKNVQVVEKEVEAAGIEFVGMLFTRREELDKQFDPQKAEAELNELLSNIALVPIGKS